MKNLLLIFFILSIASSFESRLLAKKSRKSSKMINIELVKPQRKLYNKHKGVKKDRKLLQIPRKNLQVQQKKKSKLNSISKRVLRKLSQNKKQESFVVTRDRIKKMNKDVLHPQQRNLKMVGGEGASMNEGSGDQGEADAKLDPMPILLFGDYDIEITKG